MMIPNHVLPSVVYARKQLSESTRACHLGYDAVRLRADWQHFASALCDRRFRNSLIPAQHLSRRDQSGEVLQLPYQLCLICQSTVLIFALVFCSGKFAEQTANFGSAMSVPQRPVCLAKAVKYVGRNLVRFTASAFYPARAVTIHALALKTTRPFRMLSAHRSAISPSMASCSAPSSPAITDAAGPIF